MSVFSFLLIFHLAGAGAVVRAAIPHRRQKRCAAVGRVLVASVASPRMARERRRCREPMAACVAAADGGADKRRAGDEMETITGALLHLSNRRN